VHVRVCVRAYVCESECVGVYVTARAGVWYGARILCGAGEQAGESVQWRRMSLCNGERNAERRAITHRSQAATCKVCSHS
jgi:hypothetical protein